MKLFLHIWIYHIDHYRSHYKYNTYGAGNAMAIGALTRWVRRVKCRLWHKASFDYGIRRVLSKKTTPMQDVYFTIPDVSPTFLKINKRPWPACNDEVKSVQLKNMLPSTWLKSTDFIHKCNLLVFDTTQLFKCMLRFKNFLFLTH